MDPLSVQLGRFEKEVLAYAKALMNADEAMEIRKLTPIDIIDAQYLSKAVNPKKYINVIVSKKIEGDATTSSISTVAIDKGQKDLLDSINKSAVGSY